MHCWPVYGGKKLSNLAGGWCGPHASIKYSRPRRFRPRRPWREPARRSRMMAWRAVSGGDRWSGGERSRATGLRARLGWSVKGRLWGNMMQGEWRGKKMLLGFVQKLGHENEKLIAGAISASWYEEEIGLAALEAANDQIEVSGIRKWAIISPWLWQWR